MSVRRITIVVHDGKPGAIDLRSRLEKMAATRGVELVEDEPDLVIALGGDGTMLRAAQLAHASGALLLGVNLGTLGYLTEVESASAGDAFESVMSGDFEVEERMMLECEVGPKSDLRTSVALNEVLVERTSQRRLVRLEVSVGGESLAAFNADGVIVATPTGSTAYAMSAGGPIVSPRASCLVLVPVNAHMIFDRPFVLAPDESVTIGLGGDHRQRASVVLDGAESCEVGTGSLITIRRHERPLRLVRLAGPGFVERLRTKLGLPR